MTENLSGEQIKVNVELYSPSDALVSILEEAAELTHQEVNSQPERRASKSLQRKVTVDDGAFELIDAMGIKSSDLHPLSASSGDEVTNILLDVARNTTAGDEVTNILLDVAREQDNSIERDTMAMFESMGLKPKVSETDADLSALMKDMNIVDQNENADVNALFNEIHGVDQDTNALLAAMGMQNNSSRDRQRYLAKYMQSRTSGSSKGSVRLSHLSIVSEPSNIAKLLRNSENQPWEEVLSSRFSCHTEEQLFRTMYRTKPNVTANEHSKSNRSLRRSQLEISRSVSRLSLPKSSRTFDDTEAYEILLKTAKGKSLKPKPLYSRDDDAMNCTFRPKVNTDGSNENNRNNDHDEEKKSNFVERQEAFDREKRNKREFDAGKLEYDARIDKKCCPVCGAKQSYDEIKEKRKKCPNCNVEYKSKLVWGNVKHNFNKRQKEYEKKSKESYEKIINELEEDKDLIYRPVFDTNSHKLAMEVFETEYPYWTKEVEEDFMNRSNQWLEYKKKHMQILEEKLKKEKHMNEWYQPQLKTKPKSNNNNDNNGTYGLDFLDEFDPDYDPVKEFEKRMLLDLWKRQERYANEHSQPKKSPSSRQDRNTLNSSYRNQSFSNSNNSNSNSGRKRSNSMSRVRSFK